MVQGVRRRKENPALLEQNEERGRKEVVGSGNNEAGQRQSEKHDYMIEKRTEHFRL